MIISLTVLSGYCAYYAYNYNRINILNILNKYVGCYGASSVSLKWFLFLNVFLF